MRPEVVEDEPIMRLLSFALLSVALVASAALKIPTAIGRRSLLLAPVAALAAPHAASASYAMTAAAEKSHTWQATGKEQERAAYASIEAALAEKRRFREEAGELGYVGGSYTKKSAADRYDSVPGQQKQQSGSPYMTPEQLMLGASARRLATP